MISFIKKIILIFSLLLSPYPILAQQNAEFVNLRFLLNKKEISANQTFFDILIIENTSNQDVTFNLHINVPRNWNLIGPAVEKIFLPANQSISQPVRVAVGKETTGGVGYSVTANAVNFMGQIINTASCFFSLPIKHDLRIVTNQQIQYFDHRNLESTFGITYKNLGNTTELLDLKIVPGNWLSINSPNNNSTLYKSFELKSLKDTTLLFSTYLNPKADTKSHNFFNLDIETKTSGSDFFKNSLWFKYLDWQFINELNEDQFSLIVESSFQNLFSESKIDLRLNIYGNILLKNEKNIFYHFENRRNNKNLWLDSYWYTGFKTPKTELLIGDYTGNFEQNMYGRGFFVSQQFGDNTFKSSITHRLFYSEINYAASLMRKFNSKYSMEVGGAFSDNKTGFSTDKVLFTKINYNINSKSIVAFNLGINKLSFYQFENQTYKGFGYRFNYSGNFERFRFTINNDYGSPFYVGSSKGRFIIQSSALYALKNNRNKIYLNMSSYRYRPPYLIDGKWTAEKFTSNENVNGIFQHQLTDFILLTSGVLFANQTSNSIVGLSQDATFAVYSLKSELGIRIFDNQSYNSVYLSTRFGFNSNYKYSNTIFNTFAQELNTKPYSVSEFRANFSTRKFNLFGVYFNGPNEISQQFIYFYTGFYSKSFSIMTSFEDYIYKKNIKFVFRSSYTKDLTFNNSRTNLNSQFFFLLKKNWTVNLLNSISIQQRLDNDARHSVYVSNYFELNIKKMFDFKQPRVKYYNLKALYYKDFNGNDTLDENEMGVGNVFTAISLNALDSLNTNKEASNLFISTELLSNQDGRVYYENIPEGKYFIDYEQTQHNNEDFYKEEQKHFFTINKDTTIYIPFKEKNKILGKIIMHRAKFSKEQYPLGNIRVTVSSNDQTYNTLTREDGSFEITIPVTETYTIRINNIYHENFDLRQEYFNVRFNGYKIFEVTFDLDEKKREITFNKKEVYETDETQDQYDSSLVIQQTNLRGEITDAKTLQPLFATVLVNNNQTGALISDIMASVKTGKYSTIFFTGSNYSLTVRFNGYWTHYEELNINQIITFDYLTRNISLTRIEIGELIKTNNLFFEKEKTELSENAKVELKKLSEKLKRNLDVVFEIGGHTCKKEAQTTDAQKLSENRAEVIKKYLIENGITSERMITKGYADTKPTIETQTEQGFAQNRRVELIVKKANPVEKEH